MGNKKVIIFNAPPNTGKDVAAEHLVKHLNSKGIPSHHKEVKENLFKAVKSAYGISDNLWDFLYEREYKEEPSCHLRISMNNTSPRNAMIHMSENVLKPLFGKDVFGIMAAKSAEEGVNIFSDGGFAEEVQCLLDEVGEENFLLIHVTRDGCSFEGDSRDYVMGFPNTHIIHNDGTLGEYLDCCEELVEEFLNE